MQPIGRLTELFKKFPGIGPRQAGRFVYYILRQNPSYAEELASAISLLRRNIKICSDSFQYFYSEDSTQTLSPIARDSERDHALLMVVEKDSDLEAIEKTGIYNGYYFVLGGTIPFLEKDPERFVRTRELIKKVAERKEAGLSEVILALSATPEGDNTADFVQKKLSESDIKVSLLGRGLSTGSELEYIDKETLRNALSRRQ